MPLEIERRFIVPDPIKVPFDVATEHYQVTQGYLMYGPNRTLRVGKYVPIKVSKYGHLPKPYGTLCFKLGVSPVTRHEFENQITYEEAHELLKHCVGNIIEKERYWFKTFTEDEVDPVWEVDVFYGKNQGLITAEIEIPSEDYKFKIPEFIGKEVTSDPRYTNASLAKLPYYDWDSI